MLIFLRLIMSKFYHYSGGDKSSSFAFTSARFHITYRILPNIMVRGHARLYKITMLTYNTFPDIITKEFTAPVFKGDTRRCETLHWYITQSRPITLSYVLRHHNKSHHHNTIHQCQASVTNSYPLSYLPLPPDFTLCSVKRFKKHFMHTCLYSISA